MSAYRNRAGLSSVRWQPRSAVLCSGHHGSGSGKSRRSRGRRRPRRALTLALALMMRDDETKTVVLPSTGGVVTSRRPALASALEPGAVVGDRYRIERLLGVGGMGRVWLAEDLEQRRQVAFKEMLSSDGRTPAQLEASGLLFRREYFAMKKLQHPWTVKVYDCGIMETGSRYITMEVVSGEDLSAVIKRRSLGGRDTYRILIQTAQILAFVHARLFVHCDVKADNVRVTDAGHVKLMDFGIMHPLGMPASGKIHGTPAYMAPEWQRGGIIDGRTDLYSLGVLGFFMLTNRVPFTKAAVTGLEVAPSSKPAPRLSTLVDVDPALEQIIARLLQLDPRDRYPTAQHLVAALCAASGEPLAEEPLAARASFLHIPVVVGRERETATLAATLAATRIGRARALLLGAPAGVGKSRLLQEFELDAKCADIPFALGQCRAEGLAVLAPIQQALRALAASTPPAILDPLRPVLGRLLPTLAAGVGPVFRDPGEEKIAVFDALSRWLRRLSEERVFVLCFEDLHWADGATLETMNVIIRALHGTAGLVVGAFRSDEINRLSLAFQTLDEGIADYLELLPLSEAGLTALVELALPDFEVAPAFVKNLHAATGGNAFFATECLRALIEEGALKRIGGQWSASADLADRPLPRSIHEAVLARLSTLPEEHAAIFRRLAPAGRVLDLPLVQAIAGVGEQDLFQLLDEGIERQFLQYAEGRYFFTHDTVRETIYESTPEAVRTGYHGRIAEYLQGTTDSGPEAARAIGYHFARSREPERAIEPLLRAGHHALANKALLEAFQLLKEAAGLLEAHPAAQGPGDVPRGELLIATWGKLVEVAYHSDTPACIHYADKLFRHWEATVDLGAGGAAFRARLAAAGEAPAEERARLLTELFREVPQGEARSPGDVFLKRSEYRILQSIALAIMGRTAEFKAALEQTAEEHPPASPYRAATMVATGGLTAHTGRFRGVVEELREHVRLLRGFRSEVEGCPRRLGWALGMGAYFMNMNLALMGRPLDERATDDGFAVAEQLGFTDLRLYHLFSKIVRASFIGDGAAFMPPFAEMTELMRKLGNPRLPERNLAIYTPPYYLERGEIELAAAVIARGERLTELLPGDRWLKMYVVVYRACLSVLTGDPGAAEAITRALSASRAGDFRMETLVLVYQSRFELARGDHEAARSAAEMALGRATDPVRENPFDEILARRALADVESGPASLAQLELARAQAEQTGNVLQEGIILATIAEKMWDTDGPRAALSLEAAEARFIAARAGEWLKRARSSSNRV